MSDKAEAIKRLQRTVEQIRLDYKALTTNNNEVNRKYESKIDEITEERLKALETWKEMEMESIKRNYEGQILQIECDEQRIMEKQKEHMMELVKTQYRMLSERMPGPAKHFEKMDNNFVKMCSKSSNENSTYQVELNNGPLLGESDIRKIMEMGNGSTTVKDGVLFVGSESIRVGDSATVKLAGAALTGTVEKIEDREIAFAPDGEKRISLALRAINVGLVKISKV